MRTTRQRLIQYAGPVLLISLLLAPIVASGHEHAAHPTGPCAICVATHHTPVVGVSPVVAGATVPVVVRVEQVVAPRPMAPAHRSATSRGPPSSLFVQSA